MRAGIAQRERMSGAVATDYERDFEQRGFVQLISNDSIGRHSPIPESCEHERVGSLSLWEIEFGHG